MLISLLYTQSILIPFALLTEQMVNEIKCTNVIKVAPCLFIMLGFTVMRLTVGTSVYHQAHTQIALSPGVLACTLTVVADESAPTGR